MTTTSCVQPLLPDPIDAIENGLMPHCLGIASRLFIEDDNGAEARSWLMRYCAADGYVGDVDKFFRLFGPSFVVKFDERTFYFGDTEVTSAQVVEFQKARKTSVLRALETAPEKQGRPIWWLILEESPDGVAARRFIANYLARGGDIGHPRDFFRPARLPSGIDALAKRILAGDDDGASAHNIVAIFGSELDREVADLSRASGDIGAFQIHQHRLMAKMGLLPEWLLEKVA